VCIDDTYLLPQCLIYFRMLLHEFLKRMGIVNSLQLKLRILKAGTAKQLYVLIFERSNPWGIYKKTSPLTVLLAGI